MLLLHLSEQMNWHHTIVMKWTPPWLEIGFLAFKVKIVEIMVKQLELLKEP